MYKVGLFVTRLKERELLQPLIHGLGCQVVTEKIALANETDVKLIVADKLIAQRDSKELLVFKDASSSLLVPLLIVLSTQTDDTAWLEKGFDDVLRFPVSAMQLTARLKVLLSFPFFQKVLCCPDRLVGPAMKGKAMTLLHRYCLSALFAAVCLDLVGCQEQVQGAYPLPNHIVRGAAIGAVYGGAVGSIANTGLTAGTAAVVGAVAGGISGRSQGSRYLLERGVQIFRQGDNVTIILPTDHFFESGTATLREDSNHAMESLAGLLRGYGDVRVTVAGYTDNVGGERYNRLISQAQAQTMVAFLWSHCLPWQQLCPIGYGSKNPVATNLTVAGKAANRHIEITLRQAHQFVQQRRINFHMNNF